MAAGGQLRPLAQALMDLGLRTTAYDHRRTFARKQTVQSYLATKPGVVAPEFRRLIAVAKETP